MTIKELKSALKDYPDEFPAEIALGDLMFKGNLDYLAAMRAYVFSLEKERKIQHCRFCEASISLTQILDGNYKGKDKVDMLKRAVHTFNLTTTLPRNIHNEKYGYTDEDKDYWDKRTKELYGVDLDLMNKTDSYE